MKSIKGVYKRISTQISQEANKISDIRKVKMMENQVFSVSEEFINSFKQQNGELVKAESNLEKFIERINSHTSKELILLEINNFYKYIGNVFESYEKRIKSTNNTEIKSQLENLEKKIKNTIKEIYNTVKQYGDVDRAKTIAINDFFKISSDLEVNKNNLGEDFSYLKGAIEEHYNKKEHKYKCIAVGTGAAIAVAGIGVGAYAVVDYKADQIVDALSAIYGAEENIPENEYNEYFYENGMPRVGATEKIKEKLLSKTLKDIVNKDLKESTDKIFVESLELSYGKSSCREDSARGTKRVETDGYCIEYKTNVEDEKSYIWRQDRKEGVERDEILNHIEKDDEAKKTRKELEGLSIVDCINIFKGNCKTRSEFEETFKDSILEIEKETLQKFVERVDGEER